MTDKRTAYPRNGGGSVVEDAAFGFDIVVHYPTDMEALERRVAQAHADAVIGKLKSLNWPAAKKKALIDALTS